MWTRGNADPFGGGAGVRGRGASVSGVPLQRGMAGAGAERTCRGPRCGPRYGRKPFTAPRSPPTMRFSKTEKKISAGSMAREVKASTFAVSVEYWEENTWTPSGRVKLACELRTYRGSR